MNPVARIKALLDDPTIKGVLGKGLLALVIKVGAAILSFLMFVVIARAMDEAEYGRFAIGFSLAITLSVFANLGLGTAILRFYAQYSSAGQTQLAHGFVRASAAVNLLFPLAVGGLVALSAWGYGIIYPEQATGFIYAAAILLPVVAWSEYAASSLRAFGYTLHSMAPRDIYWRTLLCLVMLYVITRHIRLDATQVLLLAAGILLVIVFAQFMRAAPQFLPAFREPSPQYDYPLWIKTSIPMWGAITLTSAAQQFDVVVLGFFMSPADAGPYFAALRTANILSLLLIAGNLISAPLIAKYHHNGDHAALRRLVRLLTAAIALPTLLGLGILALIGKPLLGLFNPAFVSAYSVLLILGVGFTFDAIAGPTGFMLQMIGRERSYLKIMAASYALTIVLQCLLIPWFGVYGAAVPNTLGLIFANLLIVRTVKATAGFDPSLLGLFARRA